MCALHIPATIMAKELLIAFIYDTKILQNDEDDPQSAVVYFYPEWVSENQRMALCGQLIGVTQFLDSNFTFPRVLALKCGKFSLKKLGSYMLCVGTDRNIQDWILERRTDMLHQILKFFHNDLNLTYFGTSAQTITDKFEYLFQIYLPVLQYAGNVFTNTPTIRLPKSASSIFLEAAQMLECLQDKDGIYGGAVLYQNKVVMSQLNTDMTKQLIITDPYRVKCPAERLQIPFHEPVGIQLFVVYVEEDVLYELEKEKIPSEYCKNLRCKEKDETMGNGNLKKAPSSRIATVMEEEVEPEIINSFTNGSCSSLKLRDMPDVVKDTVKISSTNSVPAAAAALTFDIKEKFSCTAMKNVNLQTCIVGNREQNDKTISRSIDNLSHIGVIPVRYYSLGMPRITDEQYVLEVEKLMTKKEQKNLKNNKKCVDRLSMYYNTISDPIYPWFKYNGMPASKALHEDRITSYYKSIKNEECAKKIIIPQEEVKTLTECVENNNNNKEDMAVARPTSISLCNNRVNRRKARAREALILGLHNDVALPKNENTKNKNEDVTDNSKYEHDGILTPLVANLKLLEMEEVKSKVVTPVMITPVVSKLMISSDYIEENNKIRKKENRKITRKRHQAKNNNSNVRKITLCVFGHENVSIFLLMDESASRDPDLIHYLWKVCFGCVSNLERDFEQCFDSIPQSECYDIPADSYSYINVHSDWETLQKSGTWTNSHVDILNKLHDDFKGLSNVTDITVRSEDSVIYGTQLGDSQVFYQQTVPPVAGLPMPSDLMGVVPLKAKRRLERDHGILIL